MKLYLKLLLILDGGLMLSIDRQAIKFNNSLTDKILSNLNLGIGNVSYEDIKPYMNEIKEFAYITNLLSISKELLDAIKKVYVKYHYAYHIPETLIKKSTVKTLKKEVDRVRKEYNRLNERHNYLSNYLNDCIFDLGTATWEIIRTDYLNGCVINVY